MTTASATRREIETASPAETMALAGRLATVAEPGDLICIRGELGAGKTVFAKGFGAGLGVPGTISSPSFVLMAEYVGRLPLFHLDLYRLAGATDVFEGGLIDDRQAAGVVLVEWPERMGSMLPSPRLDVDIDVTGDQGRRLRLRAVGHGPERFLEVARA